MVKVESESTTDRSHREDRQADPAQNVILTGPAIEQRAQKDVLYQVHARTSDPHHRTARYLGNPEGSEYHLYALEGLTLLDTQEARQKQRDRLRRKVNDYFSSNDHVHGNILKARNQLAQDFDLTIFDSGILHHRNRLITDWRLSESGDALTVVDVDGNEFYIQKNKKHRDDVSLLSLSGLDSSLSHAVYIDHQPMQFGYRLLKHGAAIYVGTEQGTCNRLAGLDEIAQSVQQLLPLPEKYLDELSYSDVQEFKIGKPRCTVYDLEESGDEQNFPRNLSVIDFKSYTIAYGKKRFKLQIPLIDDEYIAQHKLKNKFIVTENDIQDIVHCIQRLVPDALLPSNLTLTFTPFVLKKMVYAYVSDNQNIVFGSVRSRNKQFWIKQMLLKTLLHELMHVLHSENKFVTSLAYRCMALDGWTMEYGDTNLTEYIAVLAENFFDHPERQVLFPNGYRLVFTLLKMREAGVKWSESKSEIPLQALVQNRPVEIPGVAPVQVNSSIIQKVKSSPNLSFSPKQKLVKGIGSAAHIRSSQLYTNTSISSLTVDPYRKSTVLGQSTLSHLTLNRFSPMPMMRRFG